MVEKAKGVNEVSQGGGVGGEGEVREELCGRLSNSPIQKKRMGP